jgi:NHLM bacteriocin system ABC transporter peptidase/ATP-binding protein
MLNKVLKREHQPTRVKTPTVLQMEAVECGAAALTIILRSFGKFVSLDEIRLACGVSRDGSKASNILKAARRYGLEAKGYRREPEELRKGPFPVIIHWNFNHFVVLEGFKKNRVFINDPALGPRVVTAEEFDASFTGVVLVFTPNPDFVSDGKKRSLIPPLRKRLRGSESALVFAVLTGLLLVVPGLIIPVFSRIFIDQVLQERMTDRLIPLLIGMGLTAALRAGLGWLQMSCLQRMEAKIALISAGEFLWHVLRLPVDFFKQRQAGEIASRIALNDQIAGLLTGRLTATCLSLFTVVFYLFLMVQYSVLLTVIGVLVAILNLLFIRFISRWRVDQGLRLAKDSGKLAGTSVSGLQLIETIKSSGAESDFFSKWAGYYAQLANSQQHMAVSNHFLSIIPTLLTTVNTVVILFIGGLQVINGSMSVGMLVAFQSLMSSFIGPVRRLMDMGEAIQSAEVSMTRLDDVLQYPVSVAASDTLSPENAGTPQLTPLSGAIEVRNITFGYSRLDPPLIVDFSLTLRPGERVAIVGGSGSGKSTIARLLAGIYEPWSGEILFDGRPRQEIAPALLSSALAMVDQDFSMFGGTIRDNLTLWDATVPELSLIRACRDASVHEDISLRGGFDADMIEGGRNFSGGQRQRIEIARALSREPAILILDEATSALDATTEQIVSENISRRGCTCVIVAHRLSTIRDCDEIIVLEQGRVVQRGTHEELISVAGRYRELVSA